MTFYIFPLRVVFAFFAAAARLVAYAMATACRGGLPAAISFLTFLENAGLLVDLIKGISLFSLAVVRFIYGMARHERWQQGIVS